MGRWNKKARREYYKILGIDYKVNKEELKMGVFKL